jgi:hypothetical protein
MPTKDRVMRRAAEMHREASETHALWKNADEGQRHEPSRMARDPPETHALWKECQ